MFAIYLIMFSVLQQKCQFLVLNRMFLFVTLVDCSIAVSCCRFTGHSICALADNKRGASELLAGGVLSILASLPGVAEHRKGGDSGGRSAGPDDLFLGKLLL